MMRYYQDRSGEYYFLHTDGSMIYEDKIVKDLDEGLSSSSACLLSPDVKAYFDKRFRRILADNLIREDRIMAHVEG